MFEILLALHHLTRAAGRVDQIERRAAVTMALVKQHRAASRRRFRLIQRALGLFDLGFEHRRLSGETLSNRFRGRQPLVRAIQVRRDAPRRLLESLLLSAQSLKFVLGSRDRDGVLRRLPTKLAQTVSVYLC